MKIELFVLAVIGVLHLASSISVDDLDAKWIKYKNDFHKKYEDPTEEARRKEIFKLKLIDIEEHNAKYKQGLVSWYKSLNQFSDLTTQEFADLQGDTEVTLL
ncbi:protein CTLA-2-alpha-like [Coccinella septempunctata]|uniref:protein CTLA-2-alpha-like n=1 Tax=Coccinella septempunctata TaxID=41139 RepID=UPI001D099083|nr:protein CTLA-2-alpha-like [Coccinella septempunctata]